MFLFSEIEQNNNLLSINNTDTLTRKIIVCMASTLYKSASVQQDQVLTRGCKLK